MLRPALTALLVLVPASALLAGDAGYKLPPPEVVRMLDAPPTPSVEISPDARWMLLVERPSMPTIAEVVQPWIGLAGIRVDPRAYAGQRTSFVDGLVLRDLEGRSERRVALPKGVRVGEVGWSHTSRRFAAVAYAEGGLSLYVASVEDGKLAPVADKLNAVIGAPFTWTSDGEGVIVRRVPPGREPPPADGGVPTGPATQETSGSKSVLRTYQDLLTDAADEARFVHYATSALERIDLATGRSTKLGEPALYASVEPSPDGAHLLVERIHAPFSYVLPAMLFPRTIEVWDASGAREHLVAEVPLGEGIPMEGVRTGPRSVQWHPVEPATLVWCEALDGGDPKQKAEWRDRWLSLAAPFEGEARELLRLAQRARGLQWLESGSAIAGEYDRDRRWTRSLLVDLAKKGGATRVVEDRSVNDRYGDLGNFLSRETPRGTRVLRQDGPWLYRSGQGATKEGTLPFLDRWHVSEDRTERLWRCEPGSYETLVAVARSSADAKPAIVTAHETPELPTNYRLRDLEKASVAPLTAFPDPTPEMRGIHQELVKYRRADGVELSATLYLPKDHQPGTRLPLFVWAYPLEYNDPDTAGQVSGSPWRFVRVRGPSHLFLLTQGYAVMDNATMPVVGDPETMNDTFLEQIVSSARAAIDYAYERGVADRDRVGVGGHSYGAFMTANLLAHCDLFRAGIARSGAYNRTLTPFGFQSERRTLWEAPDAYIELSPFLSAHRVDEPILFVHGEKDDNTGTFPLQSERMYQAVKGNGGTARLVMLPGESHGYRARESVLHVLAEQIEWLDRHVKNAVLKEVGAATPAAAPAAGGR